VLSIHLGLVSYTGRTATSFTGLKRGALGSRVVPTPAGFTASNFFGRADKRASDPLAAQYSTDVCLAVVRLPDRPSLAVNGDRVALYPGYNHREIRGYHLYVDGKQITKEPWSGADAIALPAGGVLRATAVEWSGLTSSPCAGVSIAGHGIVVRHDPKRPPALDEPVKRVFALPADGKPTPASADASEKTLPRALVRYTTPDGAPWAEETHERGRLVRRAELTPDGRATLVKGYVAGSLRKRTVRDPLGRVLRVEYLDAQGYLTRVEDYSRGKRVAVIEYRDGKPTRRRLVGKRPEIVFENQDGFWQEVGAKTGPKGTQ